jgi:hypothetical protein
MSNATRATRAIAALTLAAGALLPGAAFAQSAPEAGKWQFGASVYVFLPTISGAMTFPTGAAAPGISVDADTILGNLKFAFMGTLDAHNGRWGMFTDVIYLDVGGSESQTRSFALGSLGVPAGVNANLDLDLKGTIWTIAGEYRIASDQALKVDALAGARYFGVKPRLSWSISGDVAGFPTAGRSGSKEIDEKNWDGIVGVKGLYRFGANREWNIPFYADVGAGDSDLTWQAAAGLGYSFSWGDLVAMWRYLDYRFKSGDPVGDMNFNGPMVGAMFRW